MLLNQLKGGDHIITIFIPYDSDNIIANEGTIIPISIDSSIFQLKLNKQIEAITPLFNISIMENNPNEPTKLFYELKKTQATITFYFQNITENIKTRISYFPQGKLYVSTSRKDLIKSIYKTYLLPKKNKIKQTLVDDDRNKQIIHYKNITHKIVKLIK